MADITATSAREARHWDLFVDWCASMDTEALPTTAAAVSDFLAAFPAPIETQGRRVKAIRRAHDRAGRPLMLPTASRPSALREGGEWAQVPRALAQVPKYQHDKRFAAAVRGRRDAWLIVLVGILGLSRNDARNLHHSDVRVFPQLSIKGIPIGRVESPSECPKCAVTRWLRIAGAASFGFWNEVKATVRPDGTNEVTHDCATGLDGVWRQANTLLPAVDRHGWVAADPMSARAISAAMALRQALGAEMTILGTRTHAPATGRFADATMNELAAAYDDVNERAAAALLRMKELDAMLEDLDL